MGHGFECYTVLGIKRKMPTEFNDDCNMDTPKLPNGRVLNIFGYRSPDKPLELEASLELMGDDGKFLVGYQLGYLDHHNAVELPRANDSATRTQLLNELKDAGMRIKDSDVKLYLHMDSDQFEH